MAKDAFSYLLAPVLRAAAAACETAPDYVSSFETLPFSRVCPEPVLANDLFVPSLSWQIE